jgi:hypothetical protein
MGTLACSSSSGARHGHQLHTDEYSDAAAYDDDAGRDAYACGDARAEPDRQPLITDVVITRTRTGMLKDQAEDQGLLSHYSPMGILRAPWRNDSES